MFGYIRAREDTMPEGVLERYEAIYCGLCRTMGQCYGTFSRFFLNYDFVLLAMLLAPAEPYQAATCERCLLHPIKGKPSCAGGEWLELAGAESVVLTHWKLRDSLTDGGFGERLGARLLLLLTRKGYECAREKCGFFDRTAEERLVELRRLELEECKSLDRVADSFARLLQAAAPHMGSAPRDRAMEQLLYHLGRWIYLIDALDDLEEDKKVNRYNPIAARFPGWSREDRDYLRNIMDHSLRLAGAAFQLLESGPWTPVIENILYSGLPGVEELVFSGRWREYQKTHRRKDL